MNVVAVVVVLVMLIPVYFAQRLAGGGEALAAGRRRPARRPSRREPLERRPAPRGTDRRVRGGPGVAAAGLAAGSRAGGSSSNCARADACWANIAAWIPWNSPSSQPTSWACATRISDSVGHRSSGGASAASSSLEVLREHLRSSATARS